MTAKRKLWMTVTAAVLVVSLLASILLVFADEYVPSPAPTYTPVYTPAPTPVPTGQPFTQPGNGQVEDHVEDGTGSKEFYTVQTGNGNTFYLVIDKDRLDDNAYLLSQVDEADLMEFVEDGAPEETPQVVLEETPEPVTEEEEPQKRHYGLWTFLLILLLGGAAAMWYFRVYLPREEEPAITTSEGLEVMDADYSPADPENFPEEPAEGPEEPVTEPPETMEEGGEDHGQ